MRARVLIAKPGLDGHERGAKLVARALRDSGFEVIYTGIRQTPEQIAATAIQEDVDVVGLSILSGAHVALTRKVADALRSRSGADILLVVGGTIPSGDVPRLLAAGAGAVYPTGTALDSLADNLRGLLDGRRTATTADTGTTDAEAGLG
jgi:methylmalonyl-CoA mutase C-terminal domain/subunit